MRRVLSAFILAVASLGLCGCVPHHGIAYRLPPDLIGTHYAVADELRGVISVPEVYEYPMLLASFVPLDNLNQTSPLGRVIPQQIGSRLVQHGVRVVDVRLRTNTLLVRDNQGEFALSRELRQINQGVDAYSVLTGTYSVVYGQVYVNAMVLRASDGTVLAALDYTLPVDRSALEQDNYPETPPVGSDQLPDPHHGVIVPTVFTRL